MSEGEEELPETYRDQLSTAALALLRLKRRAKRHDLALTKQIHECQRAIEDELGEFAVVLAPDVEHDCQPGWEPVERDDGDDEQTHVDCPYDPDEEPVEWVAWMDRNVWHPEVYDKLAEM